MPHRPPLHSCTGALAVSPAAWIRHQTAASKWRVWGGKGHNLLVSKETFSAIFWWGGGLSLFDSPQPTTASIASKPFPSSAVFKKINAMHYIFQLKNCTCFVDPIFWSCTNPRPVMSRKKVDGSFPLGPTIASRQIRPSSVGFWRYARRP